MPRLFKKICEEYSGVFDTNLSHTRERSEHLSKSTKPSDINQLKEEILGYINNGNALSLNATLKDDFIYKALDWTETDTYQGGHHSKNWIYRYALVRPVAEALLLEHVDELHVIVNAIDNKSSQALKNAFVNGVASIKAYQYMLNKCTDTALINHLSEAISRLEKVNVQNQRLNELKNSLVDRQNTKVYSPANEFLLLKERINLLYDLNCMYKYFANDSNIKKIVVNLMMVFFGFIPNMINYACTGDFLFFKDTNRQSIVRKLEKAINPEARVNESEPDEPEQPYVHSPWEGAFVI